jgi:hypothetical protein
MGKRKKSVLVSVILTVFIATGMLPGLISAGDPEPPGPPGPTTHTLEEIYDKVANIGVRSRREDRPNIIFRNWRRRGLGEGRFLAHPAFYG